jgi:co-chaperonin GroES (HSP10)
MSITAFEDMILVRPMEVKDNKPHGIQLPDKAKGMFQLMTARVESVGKGRMLDCGIRRPMDVEVGQLVLFAPSDVRPYLISETGLFRANGMQVPNLMLINIGHVIGLVEKPADVDLQPSEKIRLSMED